MRREYAYAKTLREAGFAGAKIERIMVRSTLQERIRFGAWKGDMLHRRALDIAEDELLVLMCDAIAVGVFSPAFRSDLRTVLMAGDVRYMNSMDDDKNFERTDVQESEVRGVVCTWCKAMVHSPYVACSRGDRDGLRALCDAPTCPDRCRPQLKARGIC